MQQVSLSLIHVHKSSILKQIKEETVQKILTVQYIRRVDTYEVQYMVALLLPVLSEVKW